VSEAGAIVGAENIEPNPYAVVGLEVEGLHGYISQTLRAEADGVAKVARLAVLYGENGTGKTTLLRLIWHLLSPHVDRGHKSAIAMTRFKRAQVHLYDGTTVCAERSEADVGGFSLIVNAPGRKPLRKKFSCAPHGGIEPYEFSDAMADVLRERASTTFFLGDDRLISIERSDGSGGFGHEWPAAKVGRGKRGKRGHLVKAIEPHWQHLQPQWQPNWVQDVLDPEGSHDQLGTAVSRSVDRFHRWVADRFAAQTSSGMASAHSIYTEVLRQVSTAAFPPPETNELGSIVSMLEEIADRSKELSQFGLTSPIDSLPMLSQLQELRSDPGRTAIAAGLLRPYIETVAARFAALVDLQKVLSTFMEVAAEFLAPKTVAFHVSVGLTVHSPLGESIAVGRLSSGEKHLLLLLTSAVLARDDQTLFIIDEPEISLNTTWQRRLLPALLELSAGSTTQFILASHALALVSGYRPHVFRLQQGVNS